MPLVFYNYASASVNTCLEKNSRFLQIKIYHSSLTYIVFPNI